MRNIKVKFEGRVQGVFFRRNVCNLCWDVNVSGWIRNIPDGTVEAEFQGEEATINKLLETLTGEFMGAFISNRIITELPVKDVNRFTILK